jgi:hypothetical protein
LSFFSWLPLQRHRARDLEVCADRATIDEDFPDVKEVWGTKQQQVRYIWTNLAVSNLSFWIHTLVGTLGIHKTQAELCDRSAPWGRFRKTDFAYQSTQGLATLHHATRIINA